MPPHRHAYRPVVMGARGAVTSAHPLASMAGVRMLLEGGNAVDAAVAVGAALNVVEPFMSSAGGIGLMLISRARTRERHVLDFIGPRPKARGPAPRPPRTSWRAGPRPSPPRAISAAGWPRWSASAACRARACSGPPSSTPTTACRSRG